MLERLDAGANFAALKLHMAIHRVTGWGNFKTARVFLLIGITLWTAFDLLGMKRHHPDGWDYLFTIIMVILDLAVGLWLYVIYKVVEEHSTDGDTAALPMSEQVAWRLMLWRTLWFYLGILNLIEAAVGGATRPGSLFVSLSMYFCFQWQPPAKSLFRKAIEGIKSVASKIKIPSLLPPIPVPA